MKKTIARLNTRIDLLEAEFKQNESRLTQLKSNRCSDEYCTVCRRGRKPSTRKSTACLNNFGHITNKEDRIMRRRFEITIKEVGQ